MMLGAEAGVVYLLMFGGVFWCLSDSNEPYWGTPIRTTGTKYV